MPIKNQTGNDERILPVVGVTFVPGYPHNLHQLQALIDWQAGQPGAEMLSVVLVRNPDNPHDPNAVQVHVPALGDDGFIGHFGRDHARPIAALMDSGERLNAWVYRCRVDPNNPSKPGIDILIKREGKK